MGSAATGSPWQEGHASPRLWSGRTAGAGSGYPNGRPPVPVGYGAVAGTVRRLSAGGRPAVGDQRTDQRGGDQREQDHRDDGRQADPGLRGGGVEQRGPGAAVAG